MTGKMTIIQEYWIDFDWNMPPIQHYNTFTHLIVLWRTPSPRESKLPNQFVPIYKDGCYTRLPTQTGQLEITVVKAPRFHTQYPKNRSRKRKRNPLYLD